ncbi:Transforming acidic coiled-coil-containing protein 2 [Fukomys damarensis]|uniref:Transforming acidic coiled-coil-containing protein 2 n=1 Tax=Fukomys damarensis TaxID=885580 RepID=A0A091DH92_FUKDA|nr:Transforming acidic coiled-coil-containing protein 2 [Fukomys damarensis]
MKNQSSPDDDVIQPAAPTDVENPPLATSSRHSDAVGQVLTHLTAQSDGLVSYLMASWDTSWHGNPMLIMDLHQHCTGSGFGIISSSTCSVCT